MTLHQVQMISRTNNTRTDDLFNEKVNDFLMILFNKYRKEYEVHSIQMSSDGNTVFIHYSIPIIS